jgi:hypothetical protein
MSSDMEVIWGGEINLSRKFSVQIEESSLQISVVAFKLSAALDGDTVTSNSFFCKEHPEGLRR